MCFSRGARKDYNGSEKSFESSGSCNNLVLVRNKTYFMRNLDTFLNWDEKKNQPLMDFCQIKKFFFFFFSQRCKKKYFQLKQSFQKQKEKFFKLMF